MAKGTTLISLIIPTYLKENQRYLDLAVESIENLNFPKDQLELIIVSSGGFAPKINNTGSIITKYKMFEERKHYAQAINIGVSMADESSEFYFLLSDDIILTKNSLRNMFDLAKANNSIVAAISNCDNTRKYQLMMGFDEGNGFVGVTDLAYEYEHLNQYSKQLMNADSIYPMGVIFNTFLCFYAVMIPAKIWKLLGPLDDNFENGQEDIDYCIRARRRGVPLITALNAVIWHFSGKTADSTVGNEMRDKNVKYFKEKYGKDVREFLG